MPQRGSFIKYWLPVVLWMAVIFSASTDLLSSQRTSRIIGPFLHWLIPDISDQTIYRVQYVVRKAAHVAEYAILAILFWRAFRKPIEADPRPWSWREAGMAVGFAALYAITDELHQYLVASRYASVWDVLLDSLGAVLGMLARWRVGRRRKHW